MVGNRVVIARRHRGPPSVRGVQPSVDRPPRRRAPRRHRRRHRRHRDVGVSISVSTLVVDLRIDLVVDHRHRSSASTSSASTSASSNVVHRIDVVRIDVGIVQRLHRIDRILGIVVVRDLVAVAGVDVELSIGFLDRLVEGRVERIVVEQVIERVAGLGRGEGTLGLAHLTECRRSRTSRAVTGSPDNPRPVPAVSSRFVPQAGTGRARLPARKRWDRTGRAVTAGHGASVARAVAVVSPSRTVTVTSSPISVQVITVAPWRAARRRRGRRPTLQPSERRGVGSGLRHASDRSSCAPSRRRRATSSRPGRPPRPAPRSLPGRRRRVVVACSSP